MKRKVTLEKGKYVVNDFKGLNQNLGMKIKVDGYYEATHEKTGVTLLHYFVLNKKRNKETVVLELIVEPVISAITENDQKSS